MGLRWLPPPSYILAARFICGLLHLPYILSSEHRAITPNPLITSYCTHLDNERKSRRATGLRWFPTCIPEAIISHSLYNFLWPHILRQWNQYSWPLTAHASLTCMAAIRVTYDHTGDLRNSHIHIHTYFKCEGISLLLEFLAGHKVRAGNPLLKQKWDQTQNE